MMKLLALTCSLLGACVPALHAAARTTEVLAIGSLACDGGSTHQFREHHFEEANEVLGPRPNSQAIDAYIAGTAGVLFGLNRALPDILAVALNTVVIGFEVSTVRGNMRTVGGSACGIGRGGPWGYGVRGR